MPTLADLAPRGRLFRALLTLHRRGPLTATEFQAACDVTSATARELRDLGVESGLLAVRTLFTRGPVDVLEVTLTPLGREVAGHLVAADDAMRRASAQD